MTNRMFRMFNHYSRCFVVTMTFKVYVYSDREARWKEVLIRRHDRHVYIDPREAYLVFPNVFSYGRVTVASTTTTCGGAGRSCLPAACERRESAANNIIITARHCRARRRRVVHRLAPHPWNEHNGDGTRLFNKNSYLDDVAIGTRFIVS